MSFFYFFLCSIIMWFRNFYWKKVKFSAKRQKNEGFNFLKSLTKKIQKHSWNVERVLIFGTWNNFFCTWNTVWQKNSLSPKPVRVEQQTTPKQHGLKLVSKKTFVLSETFIIASKCYTQGCREVSTHSPEEIPKGTWSWYPVFSRQENKMNLQMWKVVFDSDCI